MVLYVSLTSDLSLTSDISLTSGLSSRHESFKMSLNEPFSRGGTRGGTRGGERARRHGPAAHSINTISSPLCQRGGTSIGQHERLCVVMKIVGVGRV